MPGEFSSLLKVPASNLWGFRSFEFCLLVQVLSVDPEGKKLYLTRKKALVESPLPLFLAYSDARPGRVSHGYVVCIKDFGCIVRFYNDVKGLVPLSELSSEPVVHPEDVFYVGQVRGAGRLRLRFVALSGMRMFLLLFQVLKAAVLQCDPERSKMILSFKAAVEGGAAEATEAHVDCDVGKVR